MDTLNVFSHPRASRLTITISRAGAALRVWLRGEADTASSDTLGSVLDALDLDSVDVVCIEAEELHLFDIAAIRHLVLFARRMREEGRRVEVTSGPPHLRETARMLGVDGELGLA